MILANCALSTPVSTLSCCASCVTMFNTINTKLSMHRLLYQCALYGAVLTLHLLSLQELGARTRTTIDNYCRHTATSSSLWNPCCTQIVPTTPQAPGADRRVVQIFAIVRFYKIGHRSKCPQTTEHAMVWYSLLGYSSAILNSRSLIKAQCPRSHLGLLTDVSKQHLQSTTHTVLRLVSG